MARSKDDTLQDRSRRGYKNVRNSRKIGNIHRMGLSILHRLESLRKRNSDNKDAVNKDLYRMLCNKELLSMSYNLIKSKTGNVTNNTYNETLGKVDNIIVDNVIAQLRGKTFLFKQVRRVYIPKGNTGKTSIKLKVPEIPKDKIVKKSIELIMENIYEPTFSTHSHGFRPGRSCHTALGEFRKEWTGVKWVIKGDIKGEYDSLDHHTLINILRQKIKDERFIQLIWKLIRTALEENKVLENTKSRKPKGGILSAILANIYLHELDEYLLTTSNEISTSNKVSSNRMKPEYKHFQYKIYSLKTKSIKTRTIKGKLIKDELGKLEKKLQTLPSKDPTDPEYKKLLFIRYAKDWIIGIIGEKDEATKVRTKLETYMKDHLKLTPSPEKIKVAYLGKRTVRFLGYELQTESIPKFATSKTQYERTVLRQPKTFMPSSNIITKMVDNNFCTKLGTGIRKKGWAHYPDTTIVQKFNYIIRGVSNYYSPANNFETSMNRIKYILKFSCAHTLASKRRTRVSNQITRLKDLGLGIQEKHINNKKDFKFNPFDYNVDYITPREPSCYRRLHV
jgi:group II intron reverse transcriptase/maturase